MKKLLYSSVIILSFVLSAAAQPKSKINVWYTMPGKPVKFSIPFDSYKNNLPVISVAKNNVDKNSDPGITGYETPAISRFVSEKLHLASFSKSGRKTAISTGNWFINQKRHQ